MVSNGETSEDFKFAFSALKNIYEEVTGDIYNPNILIADGSAAITKGFVDAFGLERNSKITVGLCVGHTQ